MVARELINCIKGMSEAERVEFAQELSQILNLGEFVRVVLPLQESILSGLEVNQRAKASMTQEQLAELDLICLL